ncbi:MAG: hypothetical protein Q4F27_03490, partial [Desulfovibrionaceae bacterium]|nr:hypothetical protein [Desulfovibrionaceae bacterium]
MAAIGYIFFVRKFILFVKTSLPALARVIRGCMKSVFETYLEKDIPCVFKNLSNRLAAWQYEVPYQKASQFFNKSGTALDWGCGNGHL